MGNIKYFHQQLIADETCFDIHEHFIKQTYRSRCEIFGPNGKQNLIIPVHKKNHTPMKDIKIDHSEKWYVEHQKSLTTAYRSTAFFEEYYPQVSDILTQQHTYLKDLNLELNVLLLSCLNMNKASHLSETFYPYIKEDQRLINHPKSENPPDYPSYFQNFSNKFDFLPNLSLIDLLFNEGPMAALYLQKL